MAISIHESLSWFKVFSETESNNTWTVSLSRNQKQVMYFQFAMPQAKHPDFYKGAYKDIKEWSGQSETKDQQRKHDTLKLCVSHVEAW